MDNDIFILYNDISISFGTEISLFNDILSPNSDISVPNGTEISLRV